MIVLQKCYAVLNFAFEISRVSDCEQSSIATTSKENHCFWNRGTKSRYDYNGTLLLINPQSCTLATRVQMVYLWDSSKTRLQVGTWDLYEPPKGSRGKLKNVCYYHLSYTFQSRTHFSSLQPCLIMWVAKEKGNKYSLVALASKERSHT